MRHNRIQGMECGRVDTTARGRALWAMVSLVMAMGICALGAANPGAGGGGDSTLYSDKGLSDPELKEPSIFHWAVRDTPAEQLAVAKKREANGKLRAARRAYDGLVHEWPHTPEAVEAQLGVARMAAKKGMLRRAFAEYQYAIDFYSGQFEYDDVIEKQFALANQMRVDQDTGILMFKGSDATIGENVDMFRRILRNAPAWERAPECYLMVGLIYEYEKDYTVAAEAYEGLMTRYPDSPERSLAVFRAAMCRYAAATKTPRDENALRIALFAVRYLQREFPVHEQSALIAERMVELEDRMSAMGFARAEFYDYIRRHPPAALVMYREFLRQFPAAQEVPRAKQRIAELTPIVAEKINN